MLVWKSAVPGQLHGLNFAVCVDYPVLWSAKHRFRSEVAPVYSWAGVLRLRMMWTYHIACFALALGYTRLCLAPINADICTGG